jgi:uncharacterized protein
MIQKYYIRLTIFNLWIFLMFFFGCASTEPSKFYTLNSIKIQDTIQEYASQAGRYTVAVGPVTIPDYLDRPQIVTRSSTYEFHIAEFDRWAGSLKEDITRVVAENLSVMMSQDHIHVYPWKWGMTAKYQVLLDLMRFDAIPGGNIILTAYWSIVDSEGKQTLMTLETNIREKIQGQDYNAKVAAMSKAIEGLSRDIAKAIKDAGLGAVK